MKKLKIFKAGTYPQGVFENAANLVDGIKSIPAILYHTSHHLKNGMLESDIPVLGEFSNFIVKGAEIFADFMFNDKGMEYFEKDKIKNISVEIDNATGKLAKVGLLPPGIKPQIAGLSSFEQSQYTVIEFEIEGGIKVTKEEMIAALLAMSEADRKEVLEALLKAGTIDTKLSVVKTIKDSITADERAAARVIAYEFAKATDEPAKIKTEDEIRAEIKAEFEAREAQIKADAEFAVMLETMKRKVEPIHHDVYAVVLEMSKAAEFSQKLDIKTKLAGMPDSPLLSEFARGDGTQISEVDKAAADIKAAKDKTIKTTGGR